MSDSTATDAGGPWYRYFWPWFIVGLLGTAVVASLATVAIAVSGRDTLVRDDYFRDGMAINRRFEREAEAERRGIGALLQPDPARGAIVLRLHGEGVESLSELELLLSHPTRAERDAEMRLARDDDGVFRAPNDQRLDGRWYVELRPLVEGDAPAWRISQPVAFDGPAEVRVGVAP